MWLLEKGAHPDTASHSLKQTALHISASAGTMHCCKWLLHCGAKLDSQVKLCTLYALACDEFFLAGFMRKTINHCYLALGAPGFNSIVTSVGPLAFTYMIPQV